MIKLENPFPLITIVCGFLWDPFCSKMVVLIVVIRSNSSVSISQCSWILIEKIRILQMQRLWIWILCLYNIYMMLYEWQIYAVNIMKMIIMNIKILQIEWFYTLYAKWNSFTITFCCVVFSSVKETFMTLNWNFLVGLFFWGEGVW